MNDIILCVISICILCICLHFKCSLKMTKILFGFNFVAIIANFIYYSIQPKVGVASAYPEVYGLLYTYKAIFVFIICVIIIALKKHIEIRK
ncbi:MAG: hypothetical protein UFX20_11500 [Longibaculum muris]|uniref:Uncharacterized protein n=1 Tax=Longibaculum muris TaxID=1796628 RepID=A0A4R3YWR8_9FIRM|nr:hypothetical protein [Longibaculum muris]MBS5370695.1 hypothetical protein [Coprobacillus cateniformis]MCR1888687.1 hypothetical protein [Longibaculum muris]MED9812708.1 hypothetical protein [Longibaculum muris]TCV96972.1 hypothetical protein EDD60_11551 [Longibaculum muris]